MTLSSWMNPYVVACGVTVANVLVATGFSIASLVRPRLILPADATPTAASAIFAMYAAARTLPLALIVLAAIILAASPALAALGLLAGLVQLADAAIGLAQRDLAKTIGPLAIALLQFCAVYALWAAA